MQWEIPWKKQWIMPMAYDWLYLEISEDGDLPPVSDLHDIDLQEGEEVRNIAVNIRFTEGWDE